jgi:hypothetical protein
MDMVLKHAFCAVEIYHNVCRFGGRAAAAIHRGGTGPDRVANERWRFGR